MSFLQKVWFDITFSTRVPSLSLSELYPSLFLDELPQDLSSGACCTSSSRRSCACVPLAETTCDRDRTMCPRCREKYWMGSPDTNIIASTAGTAVGTLQLFSFPSHSAWRWGIKRLPLHYVLNVAHTHVTPGIRGLPSLTLTREREMEIYSYLHFCTLKKINVKMKRIVKSNGICLSK